MQLCSGEVAFFVLTLLFSLYTYCIQTNRNRQEQERIIQGIAKQIKKLDPPGRFLLVDYYKSGKPCYKMAEVDVVAFKIYQTIKNQRTAPSTVLCNASNGEDLMNSRLSNHATLEDNCFMDSSSESERDQDGKNASLFPSSSKNSVGEGKEQKTVTGKSLRLRENDVVLLVGRGTSGGTQDHPGNIELRRLCWEAKGAYHSADK